MAMWIVASFQIGLPLNITNFLLVSIVKCMEGLLNVLLQLVLDSHEALSNHTF